MSSFSSDPLPADYMAAIDLGSNSFHMIIAKWNNGQLVLVDRLREPVRLGWGLNNDGSLSQDIRIKALACLKKFGERLRNYPTKNVRAVGTKTLRSMKDSHEFLIEAEHHLGYAVDIISGDEEARLVYLGVAHRLAPGPGHRLVVDIGGGSTEIILGQGMSPLIKESLSLGCVALTKRFFLTGQINSTNLKAAHIACLQELSLVSESFAQRGWSEVLGTSGTIKAVAKVCEAAGWSSGTISAASLDKIIDWYLKDGSLELKIPGLSEDRQSVFLGGVVILKALFESLQLEQMTAVDWALREGLLFDLRGRLDHQDIRQASIEGLAVRFHVNLSTAKAVEQTASIFFSQVADAWKLKPDNKNLLAWAALVYQVGLDIAHDDYHKHSAYVVQYVDLAGFSRTEQLYLSTLVLAHRKKFPSKYFLSTGEDLIRLAILLRLAVIFHRGKKMENVVKLVASNNRLRIEFPAHWLRDHPLTHADLEAEQRYLDDLNYQLELSEIC